MATVTVTGGSTATAGGMDPGPGLGAVPAGGMGPDMGPAGSTADRRGG